MKKALYTFAAISAAVLCTVACNKDLGANAPQTQEEQQIQDDRCELRVRISSSATKSSTITEDEQVAVKNLQVFVFRGNVLDAYASVNNSPEATLDCTVGERTVYVLANEPDRSDISTKRAFLDLESDLKRANENGLGMIGSKDVTLSPQGSTISVDAYRFASRIVIKEIARNFSTPALAKLDMKITGIYVTNVPTDIKYSLTGAPTAWVNKMGLDNYGQTNSYLYDNLSESVANGASYSTQHTFFAYPNPTESDAFAGEWSARHSRLVVRVLLGTDTCYYPITLPVLENNTSYEITKLTITRRGSDDEDKPVEFADATFELNIIPWTDCLVGEITI